MTAEVLNETVFFWLDTVPDWDTVVFNDTNVGAVKDGITLNDAKLSREPEASVDTVSCVIL